MKFIKNDKGGVIKTYLTKFNLYKHLLGSEE